MSKENNKMSSVLLKNDDGDDTMKEYFDEAKKVEQNDSLPREAYDHRKSEIRAAIEATIEEMSIKTAEKVRAAKEAAYEEMSIKITEKIKAIKEAASQEIRVARANVIKALYSKKMTPREIHDLTEIPLEEIENIISKSNE